MTRKRVLVTAALPYSNGRLHVGHIAGAYLPADIYVRFLRMRDVNVRFVCGSDDHGVAIMLSADKEGKSPAELAQYYHKLQADDFAGLNINFDVYGSTSQTKYHRHTSQQLFLTLYHKGCFEKRSTRQFFDEQREVFLPDRYVKGECGHCGANDQNGDQCENCGQILDVETLRNPRSVISGETATIRETVHWFIDLSRFETTVREWLESAVVRTQTKNFVEGLLSSGLVTRSMTRDISWGIPVPLDDPDAAGKVLYVWFDAPIGYISNTMQLCEQLDGNPEKYTEWWKSKDCEVYHFIGEDNSIFHCVIWIAMLQAEGSYSLPKGVIVNQFVNIQFAGQEVEKISKSRGTAIWIGDFLASGSDPEGLRYYLTMNAPEKARTVYKPEEYTQRYNSELANILGNFVHRVLSFTHRYMGPCVPEIREEKVTERDMLFSTAIDEAYHQVTAHLEGFAFRVALERLMEFARECNRYIDDKAPWQTRKTDMEATAVTLYYALRGVKFLGVCLAPFLPTTAQRIVTMLYGEARILKWYDALQPLHAGDKLGEACILFTKIEVEK